MEAFLSGFPSSRLNFWAVELLLSQIFVSVFASSPAATFLWINSWVDSADDCGTAGQLLVYSK